MKITKSTLVYNLVCNAPISFVLSLAGALLASPRINWINFSLNFALSFFLAMMIGLFLPLTAIGRSFTALFHVENKTYAFNPTYRLLATFSGTVIFFFIISPCLSILNYFLIPGQSVNVVLFNFFRNLPFLFFVDFTATLLSDYPAYHLAHSLDPTF